MTRLLQELKKGIRAEVDESRRGADTNSENNERSKDEDEDCTHISRTHSTCALMSRHIENSFRSQLRLRQFSTS